MVLVRENSMATLLSYPGPLNLLLAYAILTVGSFLGLLHSLPSSRVRAL